MTTEHQLSYSTQHNPRWVICDVCRKEWRYGCAECAQDFAAYHRGEFDHQVAVILEVRDDPPIKRLKEIAQRQRNWWER